VRISLLIIEEVNRLIKLRTDWKIVVGVEDDEREEGVEVR
jgi:hypothetical protein